MAEAVNAEQLADDYRSVSILLRCLVGHISSAADNSLSVSLRDDKDTATFIRMLESNLGLARISPFSMAAREELPENGAEHARCVLEVVSTLKLAVDAEISKANKGGLLPFSRKPVIMCLYHTLRYLVGKQPAHTTKVENVSTLLNQSFSSFAICRQALDEFATRNGFTLVTKRSNPSREKRLGSLCEVCSSILYGEFEGPLCEKCSEPACEACLDTVEGERDGLLCEKCTEASDGPRYWYSELACGHHRGSDCDSVDISTSVRAGTPVCARKSRDKCPVSVRLRSVLHRKGHGSIRARYRGATMIVTTSTAEHTHAITPINDGLEAELTDKVLQTIGDLMRSGIPGYLIIRVLRIRYHGLTDAQVERFWHLVYIAAQKQGYIGNESDIKLALQQISSGSGASRTVWASDEMGRYPHVISWATEAQISMAKSGITDVISIDATYGILECGMPIFQVVGKAQTGELVVLMQSIIFNEREATYVDVVRHIREVLGPFHIETIFSDNDRALKGAIRKVLPNVRHHLCAFHKRLNMTSALARIQEIEKTRGEIVEHLVKHKLADHDQQGLVGQEDFESIIEAAFKQVVHTADLEKYKTSKMEFLLAFPEGQRSKVQRIFAEDENFALAYTRKWRTLGWTTSSAAEAMHSALKKYIRNNTNGARLPLSKFISLANEYSNKHIQHIKEHMYVQAGRQYQRLPPEYMRESRSRLSRYISQTIYRAYTLSETLKAMQSNDMTKLTWDIKEEDSDGLVLDSQTVMVQGQGQWVCTCASLSQCGLPCAHVIAARRKAKPGDPDYWLRFADIAARWHLPDDVVIQNRAEENTGIGDDSDAEDAIDGGSNTEVDSVDDLQICLEGFLGDLKRVPDLLAASTVFSMVKFGYSMVSDYVHMDEVLPENLSIRAATTKGRKSKNKRTASKISGDSVQTDTARVAKATGQGTPQKKPRNASKCSKCKSEGHNRKTCPQEGMLPPNQR